MNRYRWLRHTLSFIFSVFLCVFAEAQNVTVRFGESKLLYDNRYYPELFGPQSPVIPSLNVKLGWEDHSDTPFAAICNHAEYGIGFNVDMLGTASVANGPGIGNIYSVYGYIDRPWLRVGRFSFGYTAGWGLGLCFNNLYDQVSNPWNIMISFPVNAHATLGVQSRYAFSDSYDVGLGLWFNHYSNGAINFQNKGYNGFELGVSIGKKDPRYAVARRVENLNKTVATNVKYHDGFRPHFQFDLQATAGVMAVEAYFDHTQEETGIGENLRKMKYAFEADCLYKYCRTHASGLGFDMFVTPFCELIAASNGRGESYDPVSVGISALHEFCFHDLTVMVGVGRYLYDNDGLARNKILYQLVNMKYHFPQFNDLYVGMVLKAHKFMAAECVQYCFGIRF